MKTKTIGLLLLALGALLLFYALFVYDVSVGGGVVNLHRLSQQQNLVIIGSVFLVAGLLLHYIPTQRSKEDDMAQPEIGTAHGDQASNNSSQTLFTGNYKHLIHLLPRVLLLTSPFGAYLLAAFLFLPEADVAGWWGLIGLMLGFGPYYLNMNLFIRFFGSKIPSWVRGILVSTIPIAMVFFFAQII